MNSHAIEYELIGAGNITLHVASMGPADGEPVVLLHGFPQTNWCWRHVMPLLAQAGYRVLAPDLRGYGKSSKQGPFDLDTVSNDMALLLDALGLQKATFVGHDWGGAVAWHFAAHYQERLHRLVVVNCPHPAVFSQALTSQLSQVKRSWYMFFFQVPWLPERLIAHNDGALVARSIRAASKLRTNLSDEAVLPYRQALARTKDVSSALGYYRAMHKQALKLLTGGELFPKIHTKTLLVWGKADPALGYDDLVPKTVRWVDDLEVQTLEGVGHFVPDEAPGELSSAIVHFLRQPQAKVA